MGVDAKSPPGQRDGMDVLVSLPDNPPPQGAEALVYEGRSGLKLRMMYAPEPRGGMKTRGTVLVCPGRTEFIEKYFEVARDLQGRGFAVAVFDWPGQGLSARMHSNSVAGHVRHFGVYVDALARGAEVLANKLKAPKPFLILAHSMGGAIALETLRQKKVTVRAAAFSAPMWGLKTGFHERALARAARLLGMGSRMARSAGAEETFDTNLLTHDERRWRLQRRLIEANPRLDVREPTIAWVVASLDVTRDFLDQGALDPLKKLPSLVAIAAEEQIVSKGAQRRVGRRLKSAKIITVHGASHEILMEIDVRRAEFWEAFDELCKRADV
jgi:lysophospholipase